MIYIRKESEEIRQGINFYPLNDNNSFGFILKVWHFLWRVRYSKNAKKWFVTFNKIDPTAMEKLKTWEALHGIKHD